MSNTISFDHRELLWGPLTPSASAPTAPPAILPLEHPASARPDAAAPTANPTTITVCTHTHVRHDRHDAAPEIVNVAIDRGVNDIDTAAVHGNGDDGLHMRPSASREPSTPDVGR